MATEFSPAKINLFLAVTGRRADGFHDLVSVVAPLDFGDELAAEPGGGGPAADRFTLECDDPAVPVDGANLVLKAAAAFARASGFAGRVHFRLRKRIPVGAGLGGGSSNAVAALRALNTLAERKLPDDALAELAAALGSDCALFLRRAPVVMRGRGERVDLLPEGAVRRLRGRRVLLFKPSFGIPTPWAYGRMAARGGDYVPAAEAEARLAGWTNASRPAEELLFNNLEPAAFSKFPALPLLLARLRGFGVAAAMSGSGSACFALLPAEAAPDLVSDLTRDIRECWGPAAWVGETRIA
ncbi:MAG TPA: 4-(cytidine 5'-diphospho)-2-C-methyl-D-erythritol kinase [Opitutaceae bacterium]|nr:4-(cytidine 5'-diphospho)-2-C-methyl-D-erythritol kinase [Opitutaceae bacterium]